ncbi:MAG: hypothetical protein AAF311_13975 [Pseudomonadota bacterium]
MTSEVHADYGPHFSPDRFAAGKSAQDEVRAQTYRKLRQHYQFLEQVLSENGGASYLGKRTVVDAYLYVLTRWIDGTPLELSEFASLASFRRQLESETEILEALRRQDMAL